MSRLTRALDYLVLAFAVFLMLAVAVTGVALVVVTDRVMARRRRRYELDFAHIDAKGDRIPLAGGR